MVATLTAMAQSRGRRKARRATIDTEQLLAWCRQQLASFKCSKIVDVVAELPRNPTGKILKNLRKPYWQGRERQVI